jgi:hypothetical protein
MSTASPSASFKRLLWPLIGLLAALWVAVPAAMAQESAPSPITPTSTVQPRATLAPTVTAAEAVTPSESPRVSPTPRTTATGATITTFEHPFAPRPPTSAVTATVPFTATAVPTDTLVPPTATSVPTLTASATAVPPSATATEAVTRTPAGGWFVPGPGVVFLSPTATTGTRTPTATSTRDIPPSPPIRYAGVPSTSFEAEWLGPNYLWLGVPHRTQLDGSVWAQSNCGPASLGMVLGSYGLSGYPTDVLRGEVNRIMGNFNPDSGTSLPALATVARRAGLYPLDLNKRWNMQDVKAHLAAGRPVITLVRYADLPGNGYFDQDINHYIVLSGFNGDQIIYNDAAYVQGRGRALLMAPDVLERGWRNSNIPFHGVAFAMDEKGAGVVGRPRTFDPEFDVVHQDEDEDAVVSAFSLSEAVAEVVGTGIRLPLSEPAPAALPLVPSSRGVAAAPVRAPVSAPAAPAPQPDGGPPQLVLSTYLLLLGGVWAGARGRRFYSR